MSDSVPNTSNFIELDFGHQKKSHSGFPRGEIPIIQLCDYRDILLSQETSQNFFKYRGENPVRGYEN